MKKNEILIGPVDIPIEFQEFTDVVVSKLPEADRPAASVQLTDGFWLGQAEVLGNSGIEIPSPDSIGAELLSAYEFARSVGRASVYPEEPKLIQGA